MRGLMKILIIYVLLFLSFFLINSCSKKEAQQEKDKIKPTTIQDNRSIVSAKILSIQKKHIEDYTLKIRLIEVNEDPNFPNFASPGDEIIVTPNFYLDDSGKISNQDDRNERLFSLTSNKEGDTVNLILTYELKKGWLILDIIN